MGDVMPNEKYHFLQLIMEGKIERKGGIGRKKNVFAAKQQIGLYDLQSLTHTARNRESKKNVKKKIGQALISIELLLNCHQFPKHSFNITRIAIWIFLVNSAIAVYVALVTQIKIQFSICIQILNCVIRAQEEEGTNPTLPERKEILTNQADLQTIKEY